MSVAASASAAATAGAVVASHGGVDEPVVADPARRALWQAAREILVVRPDNLGDVLMTTPALRAIKASQPAARITLLASPAGAAAALHVPEIDDVIEHDAGWVRPADGRAASAAADRALIGTLARRHFDAAIVFTVNTQSALPAAMLAYLAGIPLRLAHCRENPYALLTDRLPEREPPLQRHEVARQLALVASVGYALPPQDDGRLGFALLPVERDAARRALLRAGVDPQRPYVLIHPGASAPSRRWPAADFGRAADLLAHDHPVVFVAGRSEAALVDEALAAMKRPAAALVGVLSLGGLGALVAGARAVVCNNSAPAHIAAALGTPVVVLYALTNPQHVPWRVPSRVLYRDVPCRHCLRSTCPQGHHECLLGVRPPQVAIALRELLRQVDATAPSAPPPPRAASVPGPIERPLEEQVR